MPPVFKKAISWLGLVDDENNAQPEAPEPEAEAAAAGAVAYPPAARPLPVTDSFGGEDYRPDSFGGDDSQTVLLGSGLLVVPPSYHDVQPIADRYRAGVATVMDLRVMPLDEAKRCVDFFSGMAYALGGKTKRVAKGVFLLAPAGVVIDQATIDDAIAGLR